MRKKFTFLFTALFFVLFMAQINADNKNGAKAPTKDDSTPIITEAAPNAVWMDDMNGDNTQTGLEARGWVILNEDGGGSSLVFQGNTAAFTAYEGPDSGYVGENFQGGNASGLIDQWLISPPITVSAGDTLSFWHKSPDASPWPDSIYVRYSPTAGITPADFTETWGYYQTSVAGWAKWSGVFSTGGTIRFAVQYFITDNATNSNYIGLDYFMVTTPAPTMLTIAEVREDLNSDFIPDRLGDTVTVQGVVSSPNYNTGNFNYVLWDGTAGITTIKFGFPHPEYSQGDQLMVTGVVSQFAGLTQLEPLDSASVAMGTSGNPGPDYTLLTLQQYFADPEAYEGTLIAFSALDKVAGETWPAATNNANYKLTDGVDTITMRIDKETDLDDNPEPVWPKDVVAFGSQFTFDAIPNNGYQILPRAYAEILPPGTVPVELTSFSASVSNGAVLLSWETATETNNLGFEIQKAGVEKNWKKIGFVDGQGTTALTQSYSFSDTKVGAEETYYYRLKQIDLDGSYNLSAEIEVKVAIPSAYQLSQNFPNPFNPTTNIRFTLPEASNVKLTIFNILGQEVLTLLNKSIEAGVHNVTFDAANLNSGVYYYRLEANDFVQIKKMMLLK